MASAVTGSLSRPIRVHSLVPAQAATALINIRASTSRRPLFLPCRPPPLPLPTWWIGQVESANMGGNKDPRFPDLLLIVFSIPSDIPTSFSAVFLKLNGAKHT